MGFVETIFVAFSLFSQAQAQPVSQYVIYFPTETAMERIYAIQYGCYLPEQQMTIRRTLSAPGRGSMIGYRLSITCEHGLLLQSTPLIAVGKKFLPERTVVIHNDDSPDEVSLVHLCISDDWAAERVRDVDTCRAENGLVQTFQLLFVPEIRMSLK